MPQELSPSSNFILYTTLGGDIKLRVTIQDETIWLTQKMLAELFDVDVRTISEHLQNIFKTWELSEKWTVRNFRIVQQEWEREVSRDIEFYNLDAIISVGYRVNSSRATQFRIWATQVLREYIVKGFAMDDERLKQGGQTFWKDYFRELLERVRSIRASERRIYLQITDIFAECSVDYDPQSEITKQFFATVQNKFHYAITGQTAAEIIYTHANKDKEHMWLTTWKNNPTGRIIKTDVTVAKNYLSEVEIKRLERTVSSFFDYIENVIENHETFSMKAFAESVDKFLSFNEYKILDGKWQISMSQAEKKALAEYDKFNTTQKIESDFEKEVKKMLKSSSEGK